MSIARMRSPATRGAGRMLRGSRSCPSATSWAQPTVTSTQRYFDKHAHAFDRMYARLGVAACLRRGPQRGREFAVSVVARHPTPDVLDVGCGPGRVAESVLDAGAARYLGIDLSPHMLALARRRLDRYEAVELLEGNFLDLEIPQKFDVVLALGLFDYLEEPACAAAWMRARCTKTLVVSFTRWDWLKAPIRHLRYELHRCPIFDYTEANIEELLVGAGFSTVEFAVRRRRGFLVSATP
jgi:SAM-dependent methyltransferase